VHELTLSDEGRLLPSRVFDVASGGERTLTNFLGDLALSPDGRLLYLADLYHNSIRVINPQSGRVIENWKTARLQDPVMSKCLTRFSLDWVWDGKPAIVQSRAMDDTGYVQPNYKQLRAVRGTRSIYHNNSIQSWRVQESGEVMNVHLS
jgi:hypothetical protein